MKNNEDQTEEKELTQVEAAEELRLILASNICDSDKLAILKNTM
jgi:hypothetical protein